MSAVAYSGENPFEDNSAPPLPKKDKRSSSRAFNTNQNVDPEILAAADRLRNKELELNERERNLDNRAEILMERANLSKGPRAANWPRCRPLVYMNIEDDIPTPETFTLVRRALWHWYSGVLCLGWNAIAEIANMAVGNGSYVGDFVLSLVFWILLTIIWFSIFRVLYRAARKTKSSLYLMYLFLAGCQILSDVFFCLGIPGTGAAGFFFMIKMYGTNVVVGSFDLIAFVFWVAQGVFGIYIWILARREYKKAGGYAAARSETQDAAIDQAKQHPDLVAKGAKAAAKTAANNPDLVAKGVRAAV